MNRHAGLLAQAKRRSAGNEGGHLTPSVRRKTEGFWYQRREMEDHLNLQP